MKQKQIIVLAIILVSILILVFAKNVSRSNFIKNTQGSGFDLQIDKKAVDQIELLKGENVQVKLEKKDEVWRIPNKWNAAADTTKIQMFLDVLERQKGELRGKGKELFPDFDIDPNQSFHIVLSKQEEKIGHIVLSPKLSNDGGTFIREINSDEIYLADDSLFSLFGFFGDPKKQDLKEDYWLELNFFHIDLSKIKSIDYKLETDLFTMIKNENGEWEFQTSSLKNVPEKLDSAKVKSRLERLQKESARNVLDPNGNYGFDYSEANLTLKYNGLPEKIYSFKKTAKDAKEEGYYVGSNERPEVYFISVYTFNAFFPKPETLLGELK